MAAGIMGMLILVICVLVVGVGLIIAGFITMIIRLKKRKNGMHKKLALPIVLLCIGAIVIAIPVTLFFIQRASNNAYDEGYINTGNMAYWGKNVGGYHNCFKYKNVQYVGLEINSDITDFEPKAGKAVMNIRTKHKSLSDKIFGDNDAVTLYYLKNNSGHKILTDTSATYCKKDEAESIRKYYLNQKNYKYYVLYGDSDGDVDNMSPSDINHKMIEKVLSLSHMNSKKIKEKNYDKTITIEYVSKDMAFGGEILMLKENGRYYYSYKDGVDTDIYDCIPLNDRMNAYFESKLSKHKATMWNNKDKKTAKIITFGIIKCVQ